MMRWNLKPKPAPEKVAHLKNVLGVPEAIAYLLVQRRIETFAEAKSFFRPDLKELHDPFLMKDMEEAVIRIERALVDHENILVYGDYDVDGTTSVALMTSFLGVFSDRIASYIPDRYKEGYGISKQGIDFAADNGFSLIVALDCGIKAVNQVEYAREKGVDFIICDHHLPGRDIPDAIAVLDPKRSDCSYPFKGLCGCGVGFKLIQAITRQRGGSFESLLPYLDLVVTAIGADIVPVTGENRILAYYGLQVLNTHPRPGFQAMIENIKKEKLTITDVVFRIAPRINAAGRMAHALQAADLLMAKDLMTAQKMAKKVEVYNDNRRTADRQITEEALSQIRENREESRMTTVVFKEDWHKGVIGIVASRLTDTYYRPTLVFTKSGDKLAASARSVYGFNIYNALEACQQHIEQFGGHKYAAGLTMDFSDYIPFKQRFEEVVTETIDEKLLDPSISIDCELSFSEITPKFYRILRQFGPFGPGNMRPVFLTRNLRSVGKVRNVGQEKRHLKCTLIQRPKGKIFKGIGFNLGKKIDFFSEMSSVEAVYSIDENEWRGEISLQLKLKDLR